METIYHWDLSGVTNFSQFVSDFPTLSTEILGNPLVPGKMWWLVTLDLSSDYELEMTRLRGAWVA